MLARDKSLARAVMSVAKTFNVSFMGLAGTCHQQAAEEMGVPFIAGAFAGSFTTFGAFRVAPRADSLIHFRMVCRP